MSVKKIVGEGEILSCWIRGKNANLQVIQMFVIIRKTAVPCTEYFCQALDTCLKSYFVFNMIYPSSFELVWKLLEYGIFRKSYVKANVSPQIRFLKGEIISN